MSSGRKASLFAAVVRQRRQRFVGPGETLVFRQLSSNASSSRHYDDNKNATSTTPTPTPTPTTSRKIIPPTQTSNRISNNNKNDSTRKRWVDPSKINGEAKASATVLSQLQAKKKVEITSKRIAEAFSLDVDVEDLQSSLLLHTSLSPSELTFTGDTSIPVTSKLHIVTPEEDTPRGVWPIFRIMVSRRINRCRLLTLFRYYCCCRSATISNQSFFIQSISHDRINTNLNFYFVVVRVGRRRDFSRWQQRRISPRRGANFQR
jgi:hypothetical protein